MRSSITFLISVQWIIGDTWAQVEEQSVSLGGLEFVAVNEEVDFETAKVRCTDRGGTLARISTLREHLEIVKLLDSFDGLGAENNLWIGISFYMLVFLQETL